MKVARSEEFWTVAYFLSRCGHRTDPARPAEPPVQLRVGTWYEAYESFFGTLGVGRTISAFMHSLKNARDSFDAHVESGRVGWREQTRERAPAPLAGNATKVLDRWAHRTDAELWDAVRPFTNTGH